jgi:hypothetical protein
MKSNRIKYMVVGLVVILLFAGIIAVVAMTLPQPAPAVGGSARDAVLAYSEPETDNMMTGLNANNYATFSRDFDDRMKAAITTAQFASLEQTVVGKIGKHVSRQVSDVQQSGDFVTVVYTAKFENDDPVTMTVSFHAAEPHQIAGLHFNSAKLRQQ